MRRLSVVLVAVAALACAFGIGASEQALAGHQSKKCGIVSKGSHDYRVRAMKMKCKAARKSSLKYLRTQQPRKGFDCAPTEDDNFYCQKPPKAYWATRL